MSEDVHRGEVRAVRSRTDDDRHLALRAIHTLMTPPAMMTWATERAQVVEDLGRLRAGIKAFSPGHHLVQPLILAAQVLDAWLVRHPEEPAQERATDPGPWEWDNLVVPMLQGLWLLIEPAVTDRATGEVRRNFHLRG